MSALPASVDQTLRTENAMLREQIARAQAERDDARRELRVLKGEDYTEAPGCFYFWRPLGDGRVLIEACVEPADMSAGYPTETVRVTGALLNGNWIDRIHWGATFNMEALRADAQKALQAERDQAGEDRGADMADAREW